MEYSHEQAVADGVNVDFDVYRIRTADHRAGRDGRGRASSCDQRDRQTRAQRWEELDDDLTYDAERSSTATWSRRTRSAPSSAPSGTSCSPRSSPAAREVPKTLIFAKDDSHAEDIVADRPRGVRQGQRLLPEDHLQDDRQEARGPARRVPQQLQPAHRRHRGHDRHRHRRQAAGDA